MLQFDGEAYDLWDGFNTTSEYSVHFGNDYLGEYYGHICHQLWQICIDNPNMSLEEVKRVLNQK